MLQMLPSARMTEPTGCDSPKTMRYGTARAAAFGGWPDVPGMQEIYHCAYHHKAKRGGRIILLPLLAFINA